MELKILQSVLLGSRKGHLILQNLHTHMYIYIHILNPEPQTLNHIFLQYLDSSFRPTPEDSLNLDLRSNRHERS